MGAKNSFWDRLRSGRLNQQAENNTQSRGKSNVTQPTDKPRKPTTIRKGIYLSALIYIEGEQPPAENFNVLAKAALKDRLAGKNSPDYAGLTMTLKKVQEQTDVEEAGDGDKSNNEKGDKFEF
jgi:hypothetical protein